MCIHGFRTTTDHAEVESPMIGDEADTATKRWTNPLAQFTAVILLGLVVVGSGAVWASQRAGHSEALSEARSLTEQSARSVIMPNLTPELFSGSPAALQKLDADVQEHLLGDKVVRVKLWAADGTIIYSDVAGLIGERYDFDPQPLEAVEAAVAIAEIAHHDGPENRFERDFGPLLEVYMPVQGPGDQPILFEAYFASESIALSSQRIRSTVVPIILVSLAVMGLLTLTMARRMSRRIDTARMERERLLARLADASTRERRQIAADLHDSVIQDLSGTTLLLTSAMTSAREDVTLTAKLEATAEALRHSLASLRSLAIEIHPPNIASANLELTLEDQMNQARTRHGLETSVEFRSASVVRNAEHKRLIYRFVLEGLRNVTKHSSARSVALSVSDTETSGVVVSLADDGIGFDETSPRTGMGLVLLSELSSDVGGTVTVCGRNEHGGTTVSLEVPQ